MPRLRSTLLLSLLIASSASAVTMDWTPIGNPGNSCDPNQIYGGCYGSVDYGYLIGTYEVTNAQYAEFLNAKAASDPLALYSTNMGSGYGGITRSGSDGSFSYSAIAGRGDMPVNYVSFYDALRFANWMNNGQGSSDTESGAYTLLGGTPTPIVPLITRNAGATAFLTSENEWYKAAYYDLPTTSYLAFPAGSNAQTGCSTPTATANRANCGVPVGDATIVGSYTGSASPYGTFDQGGNVSEWNESTRLGSPNRVYRGGGFNGSSFELSAVEWREHDPSREFSSMGFRLAMIPEPSTGLLVIAGLVGLAVRGRVSA